MLSEEKMKQEKKKKKKIVKIPKLKLKMIKEELQ